MSSLCEFKLGWHKGGRGGRQLPGKEGLQAKVTAGYTVKQGGEQCESHVQSVSGSCSGLVVCRPQVARAAKVLVNLHN